MSSQATGRRKFVVGAGAALSLIAANAASGEAHESASHSPTPQIVQLDDRAIALGVVERIDAPDRLTLRWGIESADITLYPEALLWRGKITELAEFRIGDNVVAQGAFEDGLFRANNLSIVLLSAEGAVSKFQPNRFSLGNWLVLLTAETKWLDPDGIAQIESPTHLADGVHLNVTGCREPDQSMLLASLVQLSH